MELTDNMKKRLAVYNTLFVKPMCEKIENGSLNVLIDVKDEELRAEAFKAVYWCGQYPYVRLSIVVVGVDDEYIEGLFAEGVDYQKYADVYTDDRAFNGELHYLIDDGIINENAEVNADLVRMAKNIHLVYSLKKDNTRFDVYKERENIGASDLVSSIAAAVHIKYKKHFKETMNPNASLPQEEVEQLNNKLVANEHTRWNAYELTEGVRPLGFDRMFDDLLEPIEENVGRYKTHKIVEDGVLHHGCICECDESHLYLDPQDWDLTLEDLKNEKIIKDHNISELNLLSLLYHAKARRIIEDNSQEYDEFMQGKLGFAIARMKAGEDGSAALFENAIKELKNGGQDVSKFENNYYLNVLKEYGRRQNFAEYDRYIVKKIPFIEEFDKEDMTVVTIGTNAIQDVIVPTILMPKKAVFICETSRDKTAIEKYARLRNVADDRVECWSGSKEEFLKKKIKEILTRETGRIVFNVTSAKQEHLFQLSDLLRDQKNVCVVRIDSKGNNIKTIFASPDFCCDFDAYYEMNHGFSAAEWFGLLGESQNVSFSDKKQDAFIRLDECISMADYFEIVDDWNKNIKDWDSVESGKFAELLDKHIRIKKPDGSYSLKDERYDMIVGDGKHGSLFEVFTYYALKLSSEYDDVLINVELLDQNNLVKNEFDVVAFKGFTPYFVSCKAKKSSNIDKSILHELAYWVLKYKGEGILALANTEKDYAKMREEKTQTSAKNVKQNDTKKIEQYDIGARAQELGITILWQDDIKTRLGIK